MRCQPFGEHVGSNACSSHLNLIPRFPAPLEHTSRHAHGMCATDAWRVQAHAQRTQAQLHADLQCARTHAQRTRPQHYAVSQHVHAPTARSAPAPRRPSSHARTHTHTQLTHSEHHAVFERAHLVFLGGLGRLHSLVLAPHALRAYNTRTHTRMRQ